MRKEKRKKRKEKRKKRKEKSKKEKRKKKIKENKRKANKNNLKNKAKTYCSSSEESNTVVIVSKSTRIMVECA
jgi:hypothetical protein